jgi:hypothetical protein
VGSAVVQQLTAVPNKYVEWSVQPPSQFPDGQSQVAAAVADEQTWVAVTSKFEHATSKHSFLTMTWFLSS